MMVSKIITKKSVKIDENQIKTESTDNKSIDMEEKPTIKWEPVAKEENKGNGNFFAKMIDFFHF